MGLRQMDGGYLYLSELFMTLESALAVHFSGGKRAKA